MGLIVRARAIAPIARAVILKHGTRCDSVLYNLDCNAASDQESSQRTTLRVGLLAISLGGLAIGMAEFVPMGVLPNVANSLDITIPRAGHLISAYSVGVVSGAPLLAAIGKRFPPRRTPRRERSSPLPIRVPADGALLRFQSDGRERIPRHHSELVASGDDGWHQGAL